MSLRLIFVVAAITVSCKECGASEIPENQLLPPAPVVTSASSQYFERIFSRLLVMPPVLEAPVFAPELPGRRPDFQPPITSQADTPPDMPNVAIAVATAQAAPVSTLLLPPFPFSQPQAIAFIPPVPPINVPDPDSIERETEPTTQRKNENLELEETTTPLPSTNGYVQGLPSNDNVNFRQYLPPTTQKEITSVEVVPVPLTYFTPPPPTPFRQTTKHIYIPAKTRITIRPSPPKLGLHVPARIIIHKIPKKFSFLAKYLPKKIVKHLHFNVEASSSSADGGRAAPYLYNKPSNRLNLP